ncbi:MAG TPA: hypothetical protein VFT36_02115 [Methylomirabilota bacterium]|nr:hypothetical protein [Methylomirabilota bacterium]
MSTIQTEDVQDMQEPITRRRMLVGGSSLVMVALGRGHAIGAASKPPISVHKSPT